MARTRTGTDGPHGHVQHHQAQWARKAQRDRNGRERHNATATTHDGTTEREPVEADSTQPTRPRGKRAGPITSDEQWARWAPSRFHCFRFSFYYYYYYSELHSCSYI